MMRVDLEPAYVLHRRPYRNTSWIAEFFTENYGRIAVVARSARGLRSRYRGKIEMFLPMLISWSGRGELKTLGNVEISSCYTELSGDALLCGFYLNEILIRLLHREDSYPRLFHYYHEALQQLSVRSQAALKHQQIILRRFEKNLLHELGYGLSLTHELQTEVPIEPQGFYQYIPDRGFKRCLTSQLDKYIFSGAGLLALHYEQFNKPEEFIEAKRLMRFVLARYLGDKPIKSRDLL